MKQLQYTKIVNKYKNSIFNQAYYFIGNRPDAEDITQEVLIKLWHNLHQVKTKAVKAWIFKVTRNTCIDYARKRKAHISISINNNDEKVSVMENLADLNPNPEQKAISNDITEQIKQFINRLPEKIRSVVIMRDIQDLKYDFIAETIGTPVNSVKTYLHRGRKLLLKQLSNYSKNDFNLE